MDTPYQPTGSGKWIWRKPLQRVVVDCAEFAPADPRDARIAQLKAAWSIAQNAGEGLVAICKDHERRAEVAQALIAELEAALKTIVDGGSIQDVWITAYRALHPFDVPSPESDMALTVEDLQL